MSENNDLKYICKTKYNEDGSIDIRDPFYDLYVSGKKITLDDLKKIVPKSQEYVHHGLPSIYLMFLRPEISLEIVEWIDDVAPHSFSYPSEDSAHNPLSNYDTWVEGKTYLLENKHIMFDIVKFLADTPSFEDEDGEKIIDMKDILRAKKVNPAITDEMVEYVKKVQEEFHAKFQNK